MAKIKINASCVGALDNKTGKRITINVKDEDIRRVRMGKCTKEEIDAGLDLMRDNLEGIISYFVMKKTNEVSGLFWYKDDIVEVSDLVAKTLCEEPLGADIMWDRKSGEKVKPRYNPNNDILFIGKGRENLYERNYDLMYVATRVD
jgi:hypothetical protein